MRVLRRRSLDAAPRAAPQTACRRAPGRDEAGSIGHSRRFPAFEAVFSAVLSAVESDTGPTARMADRAVLVDFRRFPAVIQASGALRYQQADEVQLRKALESRRRKVGV